MPHREHLHQATTDIGNMALDENQKTTRANLERPPRLGSPITLGRSAKKNVNKNVGSGAEDSSTAELSEGDADDSSADDEDEDEDDADDESDETEVFAPSGGLGLGKGKRPAIRVEQISEDEHEGEGTRTRGTGPPNSSSNNNHNNGSNNNSTLSARPVFNKKRSFSNVSVGSVLLDNAGSSDTERPLLDFPRKKMQRRLSNNAQGLLTYDQEGPSQQDGSTDKVPENAIATSDEDDDDEDYAGVDLISDSEEDEPTVEMLEEQIIMEESLFNTSRRDSLESDLLDFGMASTIFGEDAFFNPANVDLHSMFDSSFARWDTAHGKDRSNDRRKDSTGSIKRVRFEDSITDSEDSSSTTSELDSTLFPDLFIQQDRLDPSLRQLIENDQDTDAVNNMSSDEGSYWDYGEEETATDIPTDVLSNSDGDVDSEVGSSGYETDTGDTTDEEAPPPVTVHSPQSLLHRPSSAINAKSPFPRVPKKRSRAGQSGPIWGSFEVNRTKPVAMIDRYARTLVLWPASEPKDGSKAAGNAFFSPSGASSIANSPKSNAQQLQGEDSDYSEMSAQPQMRYLDVMMTGAFTADLLGGQVVGPPEAFFPSLDSDDNNSTDLTVSDMDDDEDEMEGKLNIDAFIDFGDDVSSSENEDDPADTFPATPATSTVANFGSTPAQPTPHDSISTMLERFDRGPGVVTSFRSNQARYHAASRQHQNPAMRALASKPVRSGKSAEAVMTPIRKRGLARRMPVSSSPLAGRISKRR